MPVRNTINHRQHQPDENQPLPKLTLQTIKQSCSLSSCSDALEHMRCKLDNKTITHVITKLLCTAQCRLEAWAERTRTMLETHTTNQNQSHPRPTAKITSLRRSKTHTNHVQPNGQNENVINAHCAP